MTTLRSTIAAIAAATALLTAQAAEARRVHVHHTSATPAPIELNIPDLPAVDYKSMLNADVLTIAISKTPLLATAAPGAKSLGTLARGTHLKKLGVEGGYYHVQAGNKLTGYVIRYAAAMGKIDLPASATPASAGVITVSGVTAVHKFADKNSKAIASLKPNAKVDCVMSIGLYWKIKTAAGQVGYIEKTSGTLKP